MVKSVLGVNHQGLRQWVVQRVSAVVMAVYFIGLILYLLCHSGLSYAEWHTLFSEAWVKIATLIVLLGLLYHAWIGIWTIFTDYIKCYVLRCVLNVLVWLMLFACFLWGFLIVWSV